MYIPADLFKRAGEVKDGAAAATPAGTEGGEDGPDYVVIGAGVGCAILALVIIGFFGHRYYRNSHPAKSANKEPPKYDGETK